MLIRITDTIDINEAYIHLQSKGAGAINLFVGTVRNHGQGKTVVKLVFETYETMALKEMHTIARRAGEKWPLENLVMVHAVGEKEIGAPVVIVGVSCAHRQDSFDACRFLIDEIKKTVPIWKKEFYADNSVWVNAHP